MDGGRDRAGHRDGGPGDGRGRLLGTSAELGRLLSAATGYFQRVREICDRHNVLLVSDEVICAFGRLGQWFGADRYGYQPDIITVAKGMTSGYAPIGALIASDRLIEPFLRGTTTFLHGITFGGHPVSAAVGLTNLDVFESDRPARARSRPRERLSRHLGEVVQPADRGRGTR
jgi:adenosylmethionine-8-amino-7-oxononanoate aminotransferase